MTHPRPACTARRFAGPIGATVWLAVTLSMWTFASAVWADFQGATHLMPFDEDTINYSRTKADGPVARLQERLDRGEMNLRYDPEAGYLPALLDVLGVARSSQMLVFSKTSFQRDRISPSTPRALFFNDDVYIGYIPGSPLIEISMADPVLGGVFYTLEQKMADRPRLVRTDQCLECHASAKTMGVPGHLVRSFATDESGVVDLNSGTSLVNHRTPFEERWGGWYVTGTHGSQAHRGNLAGKEAFAREVADPNHAGNVTNLSRFLSTARYLEPSSDIVALMVLEHQTHMHNFITRLAYETTIAQRQYGHLNYLSSKVDAFIRYLLFLDEAPLLSPVHGTSGFARDFVTQGPKDKQGRTLRDFDLRTRLFTHPCSYLIYSTSFDRLPDAMKTIIYQRMWDILSGNVTPSGARRLDAPTRRAIVEILRDTKPGLPDYWK